MKINSLDMNLMNQINKIKGPADSDDKSFKDFLSESIGNVNQSQLNADDLSVRFAAGDENIDIHDVMVSLEEATLSLDLTIQIRNKLVEAYQEIMRMQL